MLNVLEGYGHFTTGVFPGPSIRKDSMMDVYVRPVIPWNLECELNGVASRQEAIEFFKVSYVTDRNFRDVHRRAVTGIILLICLVLIFTDSKTTGCGGIAFGIIMSAIVVDLIFFSVLKKLNDHRKDALKVETLGADLNSMLRSCAD